MSGRLQGARIVVTGASRGLGRAVAEGFAAEGAALVLTATDLGHLDAATRACRAAGAADVHPVALDLSGPDSIAHAAGAVVVHLGRVDTLVNNAGLLGVRAPLAEYPIDVWERVIRVGVTGTLALTQALLPAMADGAAIINVTSGAAGRPTWGAYAVAKLALDGITGILRAELADRGVRCVGINPGATRTTMRAAAYPDEDPATVPHPRARVPPFIAVAAGADPGAHVEAADWEDRPPG